MQQFTVTADRLVIDERNARKRREALPISALKASIKAHGIIQPLAVRPLAPADAAVSIQIYRVIGGGRRLAAINELIAEQTVEPTFPIPVIVRELDDRAAEEVSLAENIIRQDMSPVDEFRVFKELADQGLDAEEIALRFGQAVRFIRGRMALGNLHPEILGAFERDELSWTAVQAYTASSDQQLQLQAFETLEGYQKNNASYIRQMLVGQGLRPDDRLAKFIGEEAYLSAGGIIVEDLFSEARFWTSTSVIEQLKQKQIEEMRADALKDGWKFFRTWEEMGGSEWEWKIIEPNRVELTAEQQARLDELTEMLETTYADVDLDEMDEAEREEYQRLSDEYDQLMDSERAYSAEQRAASGVVLTQYFNLRQGVLEKGAIDPASPDKKVDEKDPLALTAPVLSKLGEAATAALSAAVEAQPDRALAMLAAMLEMSLAGNYSAAKPSRIKIDLRTGTYRDQTGLKGFPELFEQYAALKPAELKKRLASLTAETVDMTEEWQLGANAEKRTSLRKVIFDAFKVDPTAYFDPDGFFAGSKKPVIAVAYKEMTGQELKDGRKADMATFAADAAKKTGWLPEYLRSTAYQLRVE